MTDHPRFAERYVLLEKLATGGMGEIFLARQTGAGGFDRLAILKSLLPELADDAELLEQFLDEARIAAACAQGAIGTGA